MQRRLLSCLGWGFGGAVLLGVIGFVAGYFGPLMFSDASAGPLNAIVTTPVGVVIGFVLGAFHGARAPNATPN
jgi:hypothetical protein